MILMHPARIDKVSHSMSSAKINQQASIRCIRNNIYALGMEE